MSAEHDDQSDDHRTPSVESDTDLEVRTELLPTPTQPEDAPDSADAYDNVSEVSDDVSTQPQRRWRLRGRPAQRDRGRVALGAAGAVAVLSVATVASAYFTVYRDDTAVDDEVAHSVLQAANDGAVSVLSYSPKTLDADFEDARGNLTGHFLTYYQEFTDKVVKPAATENDVNTEAQIVRSAVSELSKNDAQVLAFVNQSTTSKTKPDPELTSSSVRITLQRVGGRWLISSFDPV
ncbi:hypothetical protein V1Y59_10115 [Gordonia sp. PKS22-38]|uniref:Twin-arginine translocation pathway signal n=1 Tax=Gordonia prachuapensis TaxID=3115651 RepID=A0ABU7MSY3_9ACTN|nr:hypothetical protein [Gordonia sp. PKS22-38]